MTYKLVAVFLAFSFRPWNACVQRVFSVTIDIVVVAVDGWFAADASRATAGTARARQALVEVRMH